MRRRSGTASLSVMVLLCGSLIRATGAEVLTPCFLKLSIYTNLTGTSVLDFVFDPAYPDSPNQVYYLKSFDTRDALPDNSLDNYGGRIEGFITPQESGEYVFFLRSDDASELWLSDDATEFRSVVIADEPDCCDPFQEPDTADPATSFPIPLVAGQRYFILVNYKEGTGGDYAQVAWRKVGDPTPAAELQPIPGAFLSTEVDVAQTPTITITQHPQNTSGEENSTATFTVAADADPSDNVCIQWQKNGVNIPGGVGSEYTTDFLTEADNGATYRALVAVPGGFVESDEATLTVTDDTTAPVLLGGRGVANQPQVTLTFSERLDQASATRSSNYTVTGPDGDLSVSEAVLSDDGTQVTLTTGPQTIGTEYTVTVNGVTDPAATPNPVAADSQAAFFALGPWLQGEDGFVIFEAEDFDRNLDGLWVRDTQRGPASGGVSMVAPNGAGANESNTKLEYDIIFTKTGTHIIHYLAGADGGGDDSAWLHVDGARPPDRVDGNQASMSGFNGSVFEWNSDPQDGPSPMTFQIDSTGLHTIGLAVREDGAFFDKFVITTDPNFDPTAFGPFGPPATLREGEPPPSGANLEITLQPVDTEVLEHSPLVLTTEVAVPPDFLVSYQWQRKEGDTFVDIDSATLANFTIDRTSLDWDGAVLRMRAGTTGITKFTDEVTITVTPETTPPELLHASGLANARQVTLQFSEPLDPTSAERASNYSISGPSGTVSVLSATLQPNERTVVLGTGAQTVGTKYTVTANGVRDTASTPNAIVDGEAKFYSLGDRAPQDENGLLVFEAESFDRNLDELWMEDRSRGTPSGAVSMVNPNGAGGSESATQLEYDLTFTKTGTHIIWYRASGNDGTDDSGWLYVDGARPPDRATGNFAAMTGFSEEADFVWRSEPFEGDPPMTFEIDSAGAHTIALARREDGSFFDKFAITTDPDFNPEDYGPFGPSETRVGAPPLPTITLTAPADGAEFDQGATVEIAADVSATTRVVSKVEFFAGAEKIGESSASPYTFTWSDVPAGAHSITALLTDDVGDTTRSTAAVIVVHGANDALFLVGNPDLSAAPSDAAIRDRLESLGFTVIVVDDDASLTTDALGKKLIVNSSTVNSGNVADKFREAAVPVVSWEQANQDDFGMTGNDADVDRGNVADQTQIELLSTSHPLAAGLPSGAIPVVTGPTELSWGLPNENAVRIATVVGNADQVVIYGYDAGAEMVDGFTAPARRVHFFMTDNSFVLLNDEGLALFDAALSWAVDDELTPPTGLTISSFSVGPGGLTMTWTGGSGPYVVQTKSTLSEANWSDLVTTDQTTATVPMTGQSGFFRVIEP